MAYRKREKSYNLQVLESLNNRMKLTKKNYADYLNAIKGYEGECCFDTFTDKLRDCLVLHDLPLKTNGVAYQIDTVLITKETLDCMR